jgi:hypothetical protein
MMGFLESLKQAPDAQASDGIRAICSLVATVEPNPASTQAFEESFWIRIQYLWFPINGGIIRADVRVKLSEEGLDITSMLFVATYSAMFESWRFSASVLTLAVVSPHIVIMSVPTIIEATKA